MMEATRLTREGRLAEAMAICAERLPRPALLQRDPAARREMKAAHAGLPILDMVPPSSGNRRRVDAAAVHLPRPDASDGLPGRGPAAGPGGAARLPRPMGQPGSQLGLDGLVGPVPARAPAPLPDGARFEERTYANEAGSRAYKLYVPSGYTGQAVPLVVMLHGCTQSPDDFAAGTQMNELAEEQTFPGRLSGAAPVRQCVEVLELVQRQATSSGIRASPR